MTGPVYGDDPDDDAVDLARAIRDLLGDDDDRPLTREEARELERLKAQLPRPSRKAMRELGKRLARPEKP